MKNTMHLKLANIRRFLDKHAPNEHEDAPELNGKIKERFYNIIARDCLPLAIRPDNNGKFDVILLERDLTHLTQENTKAFYVLEVDFPNKLLALDWIMQQFGFNVWSNTFCM